MPNVGESRLAREIGAHLAYLRELLGERTLPDTYVRLTHGCPAAGWPAERARASGTFTRGRQLREQAWKWALAHRENDGVVAQR